MPETKRVVLVEPGDVLLIGNVGDTSDLPAELFGEWADRIGIEITVFREAIDIDVLKAADRG